MFLPLASLSLCTVAALVGAQAPRSLADIQQAYMDASLAFSPGSGASAGLHRYDGLPPDLSAGRIAQYRATIADLRAALDRTSRGLTGEESLAARQLASAIDGELYGIDVLGSYTRNPMTYAGAFDVSLYAKRDYAPKAERLRAAIGVLRGVPAIVDAARANLEPELPAVMIRMAVRIAEGQAEFLRGDLLKAFEDVRDAGLQNDLRRAAEEAAGAMTAYATFLTVQRLPHGTDRFAIGRDAFAQMLREQELITQSPEEILAIGLRELEKQQAAFVEAAREIDPNRKPDEIWAQVQAEHPTAESLLPDTRRHLEEIHEFLAQRGMVSLPTQDRVTVQETPAFMRAGTFAAMDSPGVFETKATESYYYVTPPEPEWDAARKAEWLTAFNFYTTDVVSIHEAYPGHFVQAQHLRASGVEGPARFMGSYAFIEGWAHYTEQMMLDEGFPPSTLADTPADRAKYRMAQASEALLRCCRLVAAIRMHTQGWTLDQATRLFVEQAHYSEATAREEAERGAFDPGYALYTVGKLQFLKLREDWKRQEGDAFTLRRFHDELLRHGQPPIRLLRERMLRDPALWDATLGN